MTAPLRLIVSYQEDEANPAIRLGALLVDERHLVHAEPAEPRFAAPLNEIEAELNRMKFLHMDAPPPEPVDRFESWSKIVERGSPDFVPALKEVLSRAYGLIAEEAR